MLVKQQATRQYGGFKIDSIGKQFIIIKHHLTKRLSGIQEQLNNEQSSIKEYLVYYDPNIYLQLFLVDCKFNPNFWTNLSA